MAVIKDAKLNGAQLLRELAKTGTSDAKLSLPAKVLAFINRKEKRIATAAEVIDVMEKAGVMEPYLGFVRTPELTLRKAFALATTGAWNGPVEVTEPPVWEVLLAGEELPPEEPEKPAAEQAVDPENPFAPAGECKLEDELAIRPVKKPARPAKAKVAETAAA